MKLFRVLIVSLFAGAFMCTGALAASAGLTWVYQEYYVTSTSKYWNGTVRLVDGNVTDDTSFNDWDNDSSTSLGVGIVIEADASISNSTGTMQADTIARMTGTPSGFSLYTGTVAHNELTHGAYNPSNVRAAATGSFSGSFIPDYNTFVLDLSAAYNLFANGLETISTESSSLEMRIEMGSGDGEEFYDLDYLFEQVYLTGIDNDDLVDAYHERYEVGVTPGKEYWISISFAEEAEMYNMGDAGHMSLNADLEFSSMSQIPLPAGGWLFVCGLLSVVAVRRGKK